MFYSDAYIQSVVDETDPFFMFFLKRTIKHSLDFRGCSDCLPTASHFAL